MASNPQDPWWEVVAGYEDLGDDTDGAEAKERFQYHLVEAERKRQARIKPGLTTAGVMEEWIREGTRSLEHALFTGWGKIDDQLGRPILPQEVVILGARTGVGKALADDEPVLTPNGWVPIGSVEEGMQVYGADGNPTWVTGVYPQGVRDVYKVEFSDGASVVCDADHLWTVRSHEEWRTLTTRKLTEGALWWTGGEWDRPKWRVPTVSAVRHPERDLPLEPYTLGCLLGDGCTLGGATTLTVGDVWIVEEIERRLNVPLRKWKTENRTATYNLARDTGAPQAVRGMGLDDHHSYEKFVPQQYLYASVEQRKAILAGLLDTDGEARGGSICYSSTSLQLARDVVALVYSLGGTSRMTSGRGSYRDEDRRRVWGRVSYSLTISLPFNPFFLPRKKDSLLQQRKPKPRNITAITPAGRASCTCISVENEDGLFLTRDYVVTHNTWVAQHLGEQAVLNENHRVAFISMEMSYPQLGGRFAAHALGTEPNDAAAQARAGKLTVESMVERIHGADRWWFYDHSIAVEEMGDIVESAAEALGAPPTIIILDYLGLLAGKGKLYERTSDNARALKEAAKETNTIIIACTQISRQVGGSGEEEPSLAGMRDSGAIEEVADRAFLFWGVPNAPNQIMCRIAKNRYGEKGDAVPLAFDEAMRLEEANLYDLTGAISIDRYSDDGIPF